MAAISGSILRSQLVALTNFSGTHKEHADRLVYLITSYAMLTWNHCFFKVSRFVGLCAPKSGNRVSGHSEAVHWGQWVLILNFENHCVNLVISRQRARQSSHIASNPDRCWESAESPLRRNFPSGVALCPRQSSASCHLVRGTSRQHPSASGPDLRTQTKLARSSQCARWYSTGDWPEVSEPQKERVPVVLYLFLMFQTIHCGL